MGQNRFRTCFSGDWDVHRGYDLDFAPPYGRAVFRACPKLWFSSLFSFQSTRQRYPGEKTSKQKLSVCFFLKRSAFGVCEMETTQEASQFEGSLTLRQTHTMHGWV